MKQKYFLFLSLFFFVPLHCLAQLADFTLTVVATPATCLSNGSLSFTTSGTNPEATINFTIYRLPNETTPVATTPSSSLSGLNPGIYKVIASQTLGSETNVQEQQVTITNQINPLNFNLTGTNENCLGGGTITVTMLSGNPVSYQIIAGPVTTPLQTTAFFSDLPAGNYNVRVIDDCGQGLVKSFTILEIISNPAAITIYENEFPGEWAATPHPTCDSIRVGHRIEILPNSNFVPPLQFVFTVFPPDGSPAVTVTHTVNIDPAIFGVFPSGPSPLDFTIPYYDSSYNYNLEVIDACGNSYQRNNNNVNKYFNFNFSPATIGCDFKISIFPQYFTLPVTVEFISAPAGFDPSVLNSSHPTFNSPSIVYQGPPSVPSGTYVVKLTDACGREAIKTGTVEDNVIPLSYYDFVTCTDISATVTIPTRQIVSASFLQVPPNSGITLPYDLSNFIQQNGNIVITGILVPGTYTILLTDHCGKVHTTVVVIGAPPVYQANAEYRNGCDEIHGSVKLSALLTFFNSAVFISGPASYSPGFPHDVSDNIYNGAFYMNSLPAGIYTIRTTDTCGNIRVNTLFIGGYFSTTTIETFRFCSSFDLFLEESNNNPLPNESYWVQRQNEVTGNWEHPTMGGTYIENTIPNDDNARLIDNLELNPNIGNNGHYRIITVFKLFQNGNNQGQPEVCVKVIKEFDIAGTTEVNSILNFACSNTISDVYLDVSGAGPFTFSILEKNGMPFSVENGENPLFSNLEIGVYKFQIEDDCGNLTVRIHDVFAPIVFAISPVMCAGEYSTLSVPNFPYLEYEWFKEGAENVILSTDSTFSIAALNFNIHSGVYYVNIIYPPNPDSCLNRMLSFEITPEMLPYAGNDATVFLCNPPASIDLNTFLSGNYTENGNWTQVNTGGALNVNVWSLDNAGDGFYEFKYRVNGLCNSVDEATIILEILNEVPEPEITTPTSVCAGSTLNLLLSDGANSNFTYAWTGPNNFTSSLPNPSIENVTPAMSGVYNLTVSAGNCQVSSSIEIAINALPEFIFASDNAVICNSQSTTIQVMPANIANVAYEYVWFFNNQEISGETSNTLEVNQPGMYAVTVSSGDCSVTKTMDVTENTALFEAQLTAGCQNDAYMISAFSLNNSFDETTATYLWSGPNNFYATTQHVDITGLPNGNYSVIVTDVGGCFVVNSITINGTNCKIPNAISPNDDGYNDNWDLSGFDIERVKIFNRWGREVYEAQHYTTQWFGQNSNGKMLPSGTYFYYIKFTSGDETTGWIFLSR